jgi:hypothetical protein
LLITHDEKIMFGDKSALVEMTIEAAVKGLLR